MDLGRKLIALPFDIVDKNTHHKNVIILASVHETEMNTRGSYLGHCE